MDGTLLDTLDDLADSVNYMLEVLHFPKRSREQVRMDVGNGIGRLVKCSLPAGTDDSQADLGLQVFKDYYFKNCFKKTKPYPGVRDVLDELSKRSVKMAVVSNKADIAVRELCDLFFSDHISAVFGETPGKSRKPAPDLVLLALETLNSRKEETLYIGDSEVDIETARNAGLKCISVTWGFRTADILLNCGADIIIDRPDLILDYVIREKNKYTVI